MDFLYSLYDALVSINVPNDKARAVVDAMERDMATTLATKQDLEITGKDLLGLGKDLHSLRVELKQDLHSLRSESKQDLAKEVESLRNEIRQESALVRSEMARGFGDLQLTMTLRMGGMVVAVAALVVAALQLA